MHLYDIFALPDDLIKYQEEHETVYQWKRLLTSGKLDTVHQVRLIENEWSPVPLSRHPNVGVVAEQDKSSLGWVPEEIAVNYSDCIIRGGNILMERPAEVEERARNLERLRAESQLINQFDRMGMKKGDMAYSQPVLEKIRLVSVEGAAKWSCMDWVRFKVWMLLWLVGVPVATILTQNERDVALRAFRRSNPKDSLKQYAIHKAALIAEGRL